MLKNILISKNPATLEKIGDVKISSRKDIENSVRKLQKGFEEWKNISIEERSMLLTKAADSLLEKRDEISRLITIEEGKPLSESIEETMNTADRIRWFALNGTKALLSRKEPVSGCTGIVEHRPIGIVAAIKPWNFPINIPVWTIIPALLAGNSVLFKPSERTPLIAKKLSEIFFNAGIPKNVFSIHFGADSVGKYVLQSDVNLISFVGSQKVGGLIAVSAANRTQKVILEMGGKDPAIVLSDADIEKASSGIVKGAFKNCGQVCCSIERVFVEKSIAKKFTDAVVEKTKKLRIGNGLLEGIDLGPMIHSSELKRVKKFIEDAKKKGGRILTGGKKPDTDLPGYFYSPTVIDHIKNNMLVIKKETFGPVLAIVTVKNEVEAIKRANELQYGLTATVWSEDVERARRAASKIEAGTIAINRPTGSIVEHPWGGVKGSGIGRMLGFEGMLSFTETVVVRM